MSPGAGFERQPRNRSPLKLYENPDLDSAVLRSGPMTSRPSTGRVLIRCKTAVNLRLLRCLC